MNFKEAVTSGRKVRSEHWAKDQSLDTTIFADRMDPKMIELFDRISTPLTWRDILGNWEYFDEER